MVKWNEPYQKLASCDSTGIIFVWIKYEGRWSIELINDRNTPVTSFSWSHDGRMALICYQVQYWTNFHFLLPLDFHKEFMNIYNLHKISISWKCFTLDLLNYIFSGESLSQLEFHFHNHGILKPGILFNFLSSSLWSFQEDIKDYVWLRCFYFRMDLCWLVQWQVRGTGAPCCHRKWLSRVAPGPRMISSSTLALVREVWWWWTCTATSSTRSASASTRGSLTCSGVARSLWWRSGSRVAGARKQYYHVAEVEHEIIHWRFVSKMEILNWCQATMMYHPR